jgi:hypothetical protein
MPTVVAKGATALSLDLRYSSPHRRWASLKELRATFLANSTNKTGVDVAASVKSLSANEVDHLRKHWFDAAQNHWVMFKPLFGDSAWFDSPLQLEFAPTQADLDHGERVLTTGLIQALECSLGLEGKDDTPPLKQSKGKALVLRGLEQVDTTKLKRNRKVDVYWVCGKLDGFEVQVSWNARQVTCFILTPQVAEAADEFKLKYTAARLKAAKTSDSEGMLVTTTTKGNNPVIETLLLARGEGGITADPPPLLGGRPAVTVITPVIGGPQ